MRRTFMRLGVLGLLGLTLNVGVAWIASQWGGLREHAREDAVATNTEIAAWHRWSSVPDRPAAISDYSHLGFRQTRLSLYIRSAPGPGTGTAPPEQSAGPPSTTGYFAHGFSLRINQAGWPRRALQSVQWWDDSTKTMQGRGGLSRPGWLGMIGATSDRHLPLVPLWGGLAINTAVYAVAAWCLLFFVQRHRRRHHRRADGQCPRCNSELFGHVVRVCRSCGWRRTNQRVRWLHRSSVPTLLAAFLIALPLTLMVASVCALRSELQFAQTLRSPGEDDMTWLGDHGWRPGPDVFRHSATEYRGLGVGVEIFVARFGHEAKVRDDPVAPFLLERSDTRLQGYGVRPVTIAGRVEAGWPRPCLRGAAFNPEAANGEMAKAEKWEYHRALLASGAGKDERRLLPYGIIWIGLTLDVLLCTLAVLPPVFAMTALRRRARARRARCLYCGYELHEVAHPQCPECGAEACPVPALIGPSSDHGHGPQARSTANRSDSSTTSSSLTSPDTPD